MIDAASIEVNRRLRHVKTDRLDGERLAHRVRIQSLLVVQGIRVMSKNAAQRSLAALTAGRTLDIL